MTPTLRVLGYVQCVLRFVGTELENPQQKDYRVIVIDERSTEDLHPFHGNNAV